MAELPQGFFSGDLYVFPSSSPGDGNFQYIPGTPSVETSDGRLKASLLASPAGAVLSLQTVWEADAGMVTAARNAIARQYPDADLDAAKVSLGPARVDSATASFTIVDNDGNSQTFGPRETSGADAYRVAFSETLTVAEKLAAISAFRGQAGILTLAYQGVLTLDESVTVAVTGDLAAQARNLAPRKEERKSGGGFWNRKKEPDPPPPAPPDRADCLAAVKSAAADGSLVCTVTRTPNISDALVQKAQTAVLDKVAQILLDKLTQMGADAVYLSSLQIAQQSGDAERVSYTFSRTTDLAETFRQRSGEQLVSHASDAIPLPVRP